MTERGSGGEQKISQAAVSNVPAIVSMVFLLLAAFVPWPYGFYVLLRFVVCGSISKTPSGVQSGTRALRRNEPN